MLDLNKPDYSPAAVYREYLKDNSLSDSERSKLTSLVKILNLRGIIYDYLAKKGRFHLISFSNQRPILDEDELKTDYTDRLKKGRGSDIHESLDNHTENDKCPFCGVGETYCLDHYLPKSSFPTLATIPHNLVPACANCNSNKHAHVPSSVNDQLLHPFYDDIDEGQWLYAKVIPGCPVGINFYISAQSTNLNRQRLKHHLDKLCLLGDRFSSAVAGELGDIRDGLEFRYKDKGKSGVKEYLKTDFKSYKSKHLNHWKTAMYQAMYQNYWFCSGGFREFPEINIGTKLRWIRKTLNIEQKTVVQNTSLNQSYVSQVELEKIKTPNRSAINSMLEAIGINVDRHIIEKLDELNPQDFLQYCIQNSYYP